VKKIRDVMRRSGAAPPAWLDQYVKALNETREALNALLNATDIDKAEAALNRLMERLQNLPTPAKAAIAKQIERLREVIDQAKTADPEARRQIIEEIRSGNLEKARQRAGRREENTTSNPLFIQLPLFKRRTPPSRRRAAPPQAPHQEAPAPPLSCAQPLLTEPPTVQADGCSPRPRPDA
jgi:hypothetical protein